jgi:CRISPR-associated endonuclease Cas2
MSKKRKEISFAERLLKLKRAGLNYEDSMFKYHSEEQQLKNLERQQRIEKIMEIVTTTKTVKPGYVLTFIMYDIENNKVRNQVAKYLIKNGYIRVQKSIFFGNVPRTTHKSVCETLKEVNEVYENGDSIICLPVNTDFLNNLRLIGNNVDFELMIETKNTIFV